MSIFEALVLGLIQGLAEFLPISSSGHLKLAEHFLGLPNSEELFAFDVLLHAGTLLAMLVYFREDLRNVAVGFARSVPGIWRRGAWGALSEDAKWAWLVLVTMLPTGIVALLLGDWLESVSQRTGIVASLLLVTGLVNFYAHRQVSAREEGRQIGALSLTDALFCGLAQSVALLHGISRSGSTIAAGLARGLDRDAAPRFAFLMAVPAVAAAALMEVPKLAEGGSVGLGAAVVGFVAATVSGYWALRTMFVVVARGRLQGFAWYCWAVGALALLLLGLGY